MILALLSISMPAQTAGKKKKEKSAVKAHTRTSKKTGKTSYVKSHTRKSKKK